MIRKSASSSVYGKEEIPLVAKVGKSKAVVRDRNRRLPRSVYERQLFRLQAELVTLQEWVRAEGARIVVVFDGHGVDHPVGGLLAGQRRDVRAHRCCRGSVVRR
ncbi:MAG TPA: hypothetical protein VJT72_15965 [Pseudonocardiaceae bacterium]|nr:hypothetical protein [Pseudonocardiaceae bacterium]